MLSISPQETLMKVLLISLFVSFSAFASTGLESEVARKIDGILSDTVNEGDMHASVKMIRGKPDMSCTTSAMRTPGKGLVKCDVNFEIESDYGDEPAKCENSCFLGYVYDLKSKKIERSAGDLEMNCIETLSSACD